MPVGGGQTSGGKPDKEKSNKDKSGGLGGPSSVGQGGYQDSRARNLKDIENLGKGRPSQIDGATGKPTAADRGGQTTGPGAGVAPFSRTKVKKGVSRTPTPGNVLKGALTALGMGPLAAVGTIAGSEEVDALPDIGLGYEGPIGEAEYTEADPSQLKESGLAQSDLAPTPKKKKNSPLGNIVGTLLADAGGTLVAG